ncbi:MAG TPA: DMT family transporter [Solirubrobacteraceae bacterium]|nr:DMT family transporter [Solirubrobacteraceae bacterium]
MEIILALVSALLFALGTVLQQRAGAQGPAHGTSSGLLLRMARRPMWVAGIAADGLGFLAQAAALGVGRLAVVQPLLVTSVVFALPLGVRLSGQRVHRGDAAAAVLVVAALVGFLVVARPSGGRGEASLDEWVLAGLVCGAVCAPLVLLARGARPPRRAALLGAAAGVLFALSAALTKAVVDELHSGLLHVILSWQLYALVGVGYVSMTINQLALDTGALAATMATSTALDPIASVVLGLVLFAESPRGGALEVAGTVLFLGLTLVGITVLARSEAHLAEPANARVSPAGPPAARQGPSS